MKIQIGYINSSNLQISKTKENSTTKIKIINIKIKIMRIKSDKIRK